MCITLIAFSSCGYQFQGRYNPLKELGVEKIYVSQFRNQTDRPGVEQLFSTAIIREIRRSGTFRLVSSEEEADAVLSGVVTAADFAVNTTRSQSINITKKVDVASDYRALVNCAVNLTDRKSGKSIFSQSVSSNKIYPGVIRVGDDSATVPLINESEQRLAIQFLASQMMTSVYQRMIDTF